MYVHINRAAWPSSAGSARPRQAAPAAGAAHFAWPRSPAQPVAPAQRSWRGQRTPSKRAEKMVVAYAPSTPVESFVLEKEKEIGLKPMPRQVESPVDDPGLHNPLQRQERMSTSWFGVITEYEGVLVEDTTDLHIQAWNKVADEFAFPRPLGSVMRRIKGVRNEKVISNVFHWTMNQRLVSEAAARKEAIYEELLGAVEPPEMEGTRAFLEMLQRYNIPLALACAVPSARVRSGLARLGLEHFFTAVVTAEDSGALETEYYYMYAAQQLDRPPLRVVVVGDSNKSIEAAHELGMKSVVVKGRRPAYDYGGADLVVKDLSSLSLFNMKKLFGNEDLVQAREPEPELQPEFDADDDWQKDL